MKKHSTILLLGSALLLSAACSSDDEMVEDLVPQELTDIRVVAPEFEMADPASRLSVNLSNRGFQIGWTLGDTLGIVPAEGAQAPFPLQVKEGETVKDANFTGGGWGLKPSVTYCSYYPYIGDAYLDKTDIPVSFEGQWQNSNTDFSYLAPYIHMASVATTPKQGAVYLKQELLGSYALFEVNTKEPTVFSSITFVTEGKHLVKSAKLDLTKANIALERPVLTDSLTFKLEGVTTSADNLKATLAFMFGPTDLTHVPFKAILRDADGWEEEVVLQSKNLQAKKAYKFANLNYVTYPTVAAPHWSFDPAAHAFQGGMTAVVALPEGMTKFMGEGDELAAFLNGELRGVGKYIDGAYYLIVHGNIGEAGKVTFKYYNQKKQYLYEAADLVDFNTDTIFGVTDQPQVLPLKVVK